MGWRTAFGFSKRPFIGDQTTARLAVEHPQGFNMHPSPQGGRRVSPSHARLDHIIGRQWQRQTSTFPIQP